MSSIERDITNPTSYRADNLGDTKPKILIGGKTEKFVPNVNFSFEFQTGKEECFLNLNRSSVVVNNQKESLSFGKLSIGKLSIVTGDETDIWHIDVNGG